MAKARRNLTQLRKDNRTSHLPTTCSCSKCTNDAYITYPHTRGESHKPVKRRCEPCYTNPPQDRISIRKAKNVALLKSIGLTV